MSGDRFSAYAGKAVIVTGGAGFIGANLCLALRAAGADVVAVDDGSACVNISLVPELEAAGVRVLCEDYRRYFLRRLVWREPLRFDVVFHLACRKKAGSFGMDTYADCHISRWATALEAIHNANPACRVVYTSTGSVHETAFIRSREWRNGSDAVFGSPRSDYAITKLAAEHVLARYVDGGMSGITARLYSVIGAGQSHGNGAGVLPTWCMQALAGQPLTVLGDGRQRRLLTAVDDVVEALMVLGLGEQIGVVELAGTKPVSIKEAAAYMAGLVDATMAGGCDGIVRVGNNDPIDIVSQTTRLPDLVGNDLMPWTTAVDAEWDWYRQCAADGRLVVGA